MTRLGRALLGISLAGSLLIPCRQARAGEDAPSPTTDDAAAAERFDHALAAYRRGDLTAALDSMQEAHRLSGKHELLYNVASLQRELGQCRAASSSYRDYLRDVPQPSHRREAEQAQAQLGVECPDPVPVAATALPPLTPIVPRLVLPAPAESAPSAYWNMQHTLAWSSIAVGAVAAAGSLYFTLEAKSARDDVQASVDRQLQGGPPWDEHRQQDQHRNQAWAQALGVGAGVLISGGIVLLVLKPEGSDHPRANAGIWFRAGGAQLGYSQAF